MRHTPYTFGAWLRQAMAARHLRVVDLHRKLLDAGTRVTRAAVSQWAIGATRPSPEHLVSLCSALSLDPVEALGAWGADPSQGAA